MKSKTRTNNLEVYENELFEEWSNKDHLLEAEEYFLNKYLDNKNGDILEAGTGGGRLAFYMEKQGYNSITAFDIVPGMIEHAKKRAEENKLNSTRFLVADACDLTQFKDESFDYLLYLQQVLNFIESEDDFNKSLKETHRLIKKNKIVLFAFLDYDSRLLNRPLSLIVNSARLLRGEKIRKQHLPWVKLGKKINTKLLKRNQATCYWVKKDDIINRLQNLGFKILEVKNQSTVTDPNAKRKGMLFVVCEKQ